jgi:hypothetical protein
VTLQLQAEIGKHFNRKPEDRWGYDEEFALVEVCRRPSAESEWLEILAYRRAASKTDTKLRTSVKSVLENWQGELDKARQFKAQYVRPATKTVSASALLDSAPDQGTISEQTKADLEKLKASLK